MSYHCTKDQNIGLVLLFLAFKNKACIAHTWDNWMKIQYTGEYTVSNLLFKSILQISRSECNKAYLKAQWSSCPILRNSLQSLKKIHRIQNLNTEIPIFLVSTMAVINKHTWQ